MVERAHRLQERDTGWWLVITTGSKTPRHAHSSPPDATALSRRPVVIAMAVISRHLTQLMSSWYRQRTSKSLSISVCLWIRRRLVK